MHNYLGMILDFSVKHKVSVKMDDYVRKIIEEAPEDTEGIASSTAANLCS
jgi:hypothetical protein